MMIQSLNYKQVSEENNEENLISYWVEISSW